MNKKDGKTLRVQGKKYEKVNIKSILDSDSEYPDVSSDELAEDIALPAYLLHGRFDDINFISQGNEINNNKIADKEAYHRSARILEDFQRNLTLKTYKFKGVFVHIERCVLTKQDSLCLRAVEPYVSDAVLMWFLDYLKRKDLQKHFAKHLVSCLVADMRSVAGEETEDTPFRKLHQFCILDV